MSEAKESAMLIKARMIAAAILGIAQQAYSTGISKALGLKEGRKARRGGRSSFYRRPADFYTHGSRTFLKNKRRGL